MSGRRLALFLATGFGAGYAPRAPGTAGSLVGLAIGALVAPLGLAVSLAVAAAVCLAGFPLCRSASATLGEADPGAVVWDEIAGMLVAVLAIPSGWHWWVLAFALFRAFDVLKPWPVGWLERRAGGGAGIMLDDLAAGALAWAAVQGLALLASASGY